jgi:hypothetical protein
MFILANLPVKDQRPLWAITFHLGYYSFKGSFRPPFATILVDQIGDESSASWQIPTDLA